MLLLQCRCRSGVLGAFFAGFFFLAKAPKCTVAMLMLHGHEHVCVYNTQHAPSYNAGTCHMQLMPHAPPPQRDHALATCWNVIHTTTVGQYQYGQVSVVQVQARYAQARAVLGALLCRYSASASTMVLYLRRLPWACIRRYYPSMLLTAFYFTALAFISHTAKPRPGGCHGPPRFLVRSQLLEGGREDERNAIHPYKNTFTPARSPNRHDKVQTTITDYIKDDTPEGYAEVDRAATLIEERTRCARKRETKQRIKMHKGTHSDN